jgi:hypothetical protein
VPQRGQLLGVRGLQQWRAFVDRALRRDKIAASVDVSRRLAALLDPQDLSVLDPGIQGDRRSTDASPHAFRPQFLHRGLVSLNQVCDVLVCVSRAHEPMMGRYVQPVLAVQQPQAGTRGRVPLVRIPDAIDRSTRCMHPEHGSNACCHGLIVPFLSKPVDLGPKAVAHRVHTCKQLRLLAQAS